MMHRPLPLIAVALGLVLGTPAMAEGFQFPWQNPGGWFGQNKPQRAPEPQPAPAAQPAKPQAKSEAKAEAKPQSKPVGAAPTPAPKPPIRQAQATPKPAAAAAPAQAEAGPAQPATVEKLTAYYNSVQALTGTFTQIDPDGSRKSGDFYMQKPGRVRFEYDAPSPIELVANGQSVAVRDRKLNTQDITPLSQTPLRFLLAERVDLGADPHVKGIYQDASFISVVMEENVPMIGTYRLLILFDAKTYQLKQWIVTDPQGYDTQVSLANLNPNRRPDPKLFVINFERMLQ